MSQARTHILPKQQQRAHLGITDYKVAGGVKVEAQRAARAHIGQRLRVQVVSARRPGVGPGQPHVAKLVEQPQRAIRAHRHRLCGVGARRQLAAGHSGGFTRQAGELSDAGVEGVVP